MLPISPAQVQQILLEHPEIEAVYLTNPTYEGLCFDLPAMKAAVGGRLFIVDEAHGAHFYFSSDCPQGALENGCADAAVTSLHKMLGTIYGTAMVNVGTTGKLDLEKVKMVHQMVAAGDGDGISPLLVADIEGCITEFSTNGQALIGESIKNVVKIKAAVNLLKNVKICSVPGYEVDPTKFIMTIKGLSGANIWDLLERKYFINIEKVTKKAAITTVHAHINDEDVAALIAAL